MCTGLASRRDFITGYTALHWAAKNGQSDVVKLLMGCSEPPEVDTRSHGGYTPLHVAAMNSRYEVIELLVVVYKADTDATDFAGRKPIYYLDHDAPPSRRPSALIRRFVRPITTRNSCFCTLNYFTLSAERPEELLLGSLRRATFFKIQ